MENSKARLFMEINKGAIVVNVSGRIPVEVPGPNKLNRDGHSLEVREGVVATKKMTKIIEGKDNGSRLGEKNDISPSHKNGVNTLVLVSPLNESRKDSPPCV